MPKNISDTTTEEAIEVALSGGDGPAPDEVRMYNPTSVQITATVNVADDIGYDGQIYVAARRKRLRDTMEDFKVASVAAELHEAGHLHLRELADEDMHTDRLVYTNEFMMTFIPVSSDGTGVLTDSDEELLDAYYEEVATKVWERSEEHKFHTPSRSRVRESMADDIGPDAQEDFEQGVEALGSARGNGDGLDEVEVSLLTAARNKELFYDISRWGEREGVASKATFSRVKSNLEDAGLVETEKVPIDVGRPRQRLKLREDLQDVPMDQIIAAGTSVLN